MLGYYRWFLKLWKQAKLRMIFVLFLTVISIVFKTSFPVFLKVIIDELGGNYKPESVYKLIGLFALFIVAYEVSRELLPTFRGYLNMLFAAMIRNRYFEIYTKKAFGFFNKYRTGDLLTRLTDDVDGSWNRIHWYSCSGVLRPVEAILILGFTLGVMFYYSWELTLYTFLPLPLLVLVLSMTEDKLVMYTNEKQKAISKCYDVLEACFSGIRVIKTTLSEEDQIRKYEEVLNDRVKKEKSFLKMNQVIYLLSHLVNHAGSIIVIFIGGVYVIKGHITLGTLLMFILYLQKMIEPIWTLGFFYASSKQVFRYVDRLVETEKSGDDCDTGKGTEPVEQFQTLELKNVSFGYGEDETLLRDFSLTLARGEKIAIMGPVGAGKTTLLELIAGNMMPVCGDILINGRKLDEYKPEDFRKIVGYVRQQNILFSETIQQNIELGDAFSKDAIDRKVDIALMKDEIRAFPKGFDTKLGQGGLSLSGGQKQRLSITRSIIREPQLLLMDDCTSAMDAHTEAIFWDNFDKTFPDMACIIVTHRMATARKADRIYTLSKECAVPEEELVRKPEVELDPSAIT